MPTNTRTIRENAALGATPASDDSIPIWDESEGEYKRVEYSDLLGDGGLVTGGGTVDTQGFTLSFPADGIAALRSGSPTTGRVAQWADGNTVTNSTLAKTGAGVLTLSASGAFTLTIPATGTAALRNVANTFTANQTINAALAATLQGVNDSHVFTGAAGQVAPVVQVIGNIDLRGNNYRLKNPIVSVQAATNTSVPSIGSPRMAMLTLEMEYDGSENVNESSEISVGGGGVVALDWRSISVLAASVAYGGIGQFQSRRTVYEPVALHTNNTYTALTQKSTVTVGSGYTFTTEIKSSSGGVIQIRTTRTGGVTSVAKIYVSLLLA